MRALPVEATLLVLACVAFYLVHRHLVAVPLLLVIFTVGPLGGAVLGDAVNLVLFRRLGKHAGRHD